ncbi:MAG: N-acetylmuramoyl-L-alanine amidase [Phascolarctobacterium sp.]|nr:N-acetylmuramoyl-L-alanine amidase [Phascolarctobacterium sp.]
MKKNFTMAVIFCTLVICSLASAAAKVTDARWGVDKNNVLRLVVDLSDSANYEMKMSDFNKLNLIVDASAGSNVKKSYTVKSSLSNSMRVYEEGKKTIVELTLNKSITEKDYKGFILKKDPKSDRPYRIVMDVTADKKEVVVPTTTAKASAGSSVTATTSTAPTKPSVVVSNKPSGKRGTIIKTQPASTTATQTSVEASKTEVTKTEVPKAEAPKQETKKVDTPKVEATKATSKRSDKRSDIKVIAKTKNTSTTTTESKVSTSKTTSTTKKETGIPAIKATKKYTVSGGIKGKTIVIDPGHGGSDPGAIGASGLKEKDVTLPIAKLLKQELENMGAKVYMSRTTDVDVCKPGASDRDELQARVNAAEKNNCDAFISLHINASTNKSVGGFSTYYYPKTDYDLKLARSIQNKLAKNFSLNDLGVREAGFYVIKRSSMPAVLCEMLFISNAKEEKLLQNSWFRKKSARMIAEGIENYFK